MALTKEAAPEGDVLDILMPEDSEEIAMGIAPEAMAHIIGRLTDMYPDPVSATVREIISNATDATKTLPEELRLPIEIVTPSTFNPVFSVKDFGCGMSLETIRKINSQYGGTTKKLDFRAIGAYGLGAKAPLSYCNEFTVSTTHEGWTTDFRVSRKAIGNKTEILLHRETDLPNGTTVTIPVRSQDNSRFLKAIETYRNFSFDTDFTIDDVPNVKNERYIEFDQILLDEDDNVWGSAWADRNALANIFINGCSGNVFGTSVKYSLSGWLYNPPRDQNSIFANNGYGSSSNPDFIVELKPGVVDFGSGRDEIIENDRSFELNRKIADRIGVLNEYMVDNILKVYREMDAIEAGQFIAKIHAYIEIENDEVVFVDRKKNDGTGDTPTVRRQMSDLTTKSGFNPISILSTTHKKNIDAIAVYSASNEFGALEIERKGLFPSVKSWSPEDTAKANRYYYRSRKVRISEINEHLNLGVSAAEPSESLVDFIAAAAFFNYNSKVVVVTNVTEENFKKITSLRLSIGTNVLNDRTVFFTREESIDQTEIDLVSPLLKDPLEFLTADELISKGKESRKAMRAAEGTKASKGDSYFPMGRIEIEDLSKADIPELLKKIERRQIENCSKSVQEIIDENAILIMTNNSAPVKNIIIGAANAGFDFVDRAVYIVRSNMYAEQYKALVDYDGVLFNKEWSYNCNAAYKISARGGFDSAVLNSEVMEMTEEDVVWKYLYKSSRYSSSSFASIISPLFSDNTIREALDLTGFIPADEYTLRWANNLQVDFDLLSLRIGKEKAMIVDNFQSFQKKIHQRQTLEERLLDDISSSKLDLNDELLAPIVKRYVTRYTEYLEEAKAAAEASRIEAEKAPEENQPV